MKIVTSQKLYDQALQVIPGGVNSPVRACRSVGATPLFIERADGCRIYDADGNGYIDYVGSWGPMILGHRHPDVIAALAAVLEKGTSFGAPTALEVQLAAKVKELMPAMEMVRMVNSGTEATMSAIRLARGVTGRDLIIKFDGSYHGHADMLLVEAGSGVATLNIPGSPGVPKAVTAATLSLPYNDTAAFKTIMREKGDQIAAVIVEPVAGNMGLVRPLPGFLESLRAETAKSGTLLIFDEVMTGFRVALGGAQALFQIQPDLTCLGKIIGGGLPVGAYGGRREIMAHIAPQGRIYQAGTLSGNPAAMAAGLATLNVISRPGFYESLDQLAETLLNGLKEAAADAGVKIQADRAGSMLGLFFTDRPVIDFGSAKTSNLSRFATYFQWMREEGIYLAPSQFETFFVSAAHDPEAITATITAARRVFDRL